jgi:hypothetical protein
MLYGRESPKAGVTQDVVITGAWSVHLSGCDQIGADLLRTYARDAYKHDTSGTYVTRSSYDIWEIDF